MRVYGLDYVCDADELDELTVVSDETLLFENMDDPEFRDDAAARWLRKRTH